MDVDEVDCGSLHESEFSFSDDMERSYEAINSTIYSDFGCSMAELCAIITQCDVIYTPSPTPVWCQNVLFILIF